MQELIKDAFMSLASAGINEASFVNVMTSYEIDEMELERTPAASEEKSADAEYHI